MTAIGLYLLKVIFCSGVLFSYYWLALRNKTFHQWNRFYLLSAVALSLVVPFLKIRIGQTQTATHNPVFRLLRVVTANSEVIVESKGSNTFAFTPEQYALLGYAAISVLLLFVIVVNATRIYNILRSFPKTKIDTVYFLNTHAKGTPFSFLNYIVWNQNIDIASETGRQIFRHELAHVQQRHTWDKIALLIVLIPFWANPFFWLIRKELHALHEFEADAKALEQHDPAALALLILNTTFPQQTFLFTNHLFQSTIKRRIAMFTKLQHPTASYISRAAALPLLLLLIVSFALKTEPPALTNSLYPDNVITVVIDAGHGGEDGGARVSDLFEKDLALAISKKIKEQNKNSNVHIILTRGSDTKPDLKSRVQIAADAKADLFLSIHVNAADAISEGEQVQETEESGLEVVVPTKNPPYQQQSEILGSVLVQELGRAYTTQPNLIRSKTGVWVIDQNVCPAVLIECGYLTNKKDREFITQGKNQAIIADKILYAIERYGLLKNSSKAFSVTDTVPKRNYKNKAVADVQYFEWPKKEVHILFADGAKETISVNEAIKENLFDSSEKSHIAHKPWTTEKDASPRLAQGDFFIRKASVDEANKFKGIVLLDDKLFKGTFQQLPLSAHEIAYISIVKGNAFASEFELKPGDSVLVVSSKDFIKKNRRTDNEPLFDKTEIEATFPETGGGWIAYLQKNLNPTVPVTKGAKPGTYKAVVGFIVDADGKLYDIKPITTYGYGMEEEIMRLLKKSPDWIPAKQNGRNVTAYRKQPVTFVVSAH